MTFTEAFQAAIFPGIYAPVSVTAVAFCWAAGINLRDWLRERNNPTNYRGNNLVTAGIGLVFDALSTLFPWFIAALASTVGWVFWAALTSIYALTR